MLLKNDINGIIEALEKLPSLARRVISGVPVLIIAVEQELPIIVQLLLSKGADPTATCTAEAGESRAGKDSALRVALRGDRPYITRILTERYLESQYLEKGLFLSTRELEMNFEGSAVQQTAARRILVQIYASMSTEKLLLGIPADFRAEPAQTLLDLIELAAATQRMALREKATNPALSDEMMNSSARLQLGAAGCLHTLGTLKDGLGRFVVDELLKSPIGQQTLFTAIQNQCKLFVTCPEVTPFLLRDFRGELLDGILQHCAEPLEVLWGSARLLVVYVCNLALLPLVAVLPAIETLVYESLCQVHYDVTKDNVEKATRERTRIAAPRSPGVEMWKRLKPQGFSRKVRCESDAASAARSVALPASGEAASTTRPPAAPRVAAPLVKHDISFLNLIKAATSKQGLDELSEAQESRLSRWVRSHASSLFACYLYRLPWFKWATRLLFDLALALLLTNFNLADARYAHASLRGGAELDPRACGRFFCGLAGRQPYQLVWWLCFVWSIGGCCSEWGQWLANRHWRTELLSFFRPDVGSMYRADIFNSLDFFTFHVMVVATLLPIAEPDTTRLSAKAVLWSLISACAWLRLLRVLQISTRFGPLVLMMVNMLSDVISLLVLTFFVLLAITSAIYILFNSHTSSGPASVADLESCAEVYELRGRFNNFFSVFFVLFNGAFNGEHARTVACLIRYADPQYDPDDYAAMVFTWMFGFSFMLMTTVLLLNMLIAMMAKTFDNVWEASELQSQYLFARQAFFQSNRPPEPPPLNMMRIPTIVIFLVLKGLRLAQRPGWRSRRITDEALRFVLSGFQFSRSVDHTSPRSENLDERNEYKGTSILGRNTFDSWRKGLSEGQLGELLVEFVTSHLDDAAAEERWRSKMTKRITSLIETSAARTGERLDAQERMLHEIRGTLQKLVGESHQPPCTSSASTSSPSRKVRGGAEVAAAGVAGEPSPPEPPSGAFAHLSVEP